MPVKWKIFQDFSKNLRSALQLEGFVDALFDSSSMAQLCQNGHRKRHCAKHGIPRLKIHRMGHLQTQSRRSIWLGARRLVGRSLAASILTADVRTAPEQQNDKKPTSATRVPEVGGEHRKGMCTCRKPMLPRQDSGGRDCPQKLPATVGPLSGKGQFLTNPKTL